MENITEQENLSRLRWQCRRGMLELDLFFEQFLDKGYSQLDADGQQIFEKILAMQDQTLLEYLLGQGQPDDADVHDLIQKIRQTASPDH